jgi:hypothetical protein
VGSEPTWTNRKTEEVNRAELEAFVDAEYGGFDRPEHQVLTAGAGRLRA